MNEWYCFQASDGTEPDTAAQRRVTRPAQIRRLVYMYSVCSLAADGYDNWANHSAERLQGAQRLHDNNTVRRFQIGFKSLRVTSKHNLLRLPNESGPLAPNSQSIIPDTTISKMAIFRGKVTVIISNILHRKHRLETIRVTDFGGLSFSLGLIRPR